MVVFQLLPSFTFFTKVFLKKQLRNYFFFILATLLILAAEERPYSIASNIYSF